MDKFVVRQQLCQSTTDLLDPILVLGRRFSVIHCGAVSGYGNVEVSEI